MRIRYAFVVTAVAMLLTVTIAEAQRHASAGPPPGGGEAALARYLQLTADQIASWQQIHKDTAAAIEPLAANARGLREQLEAALNGASPNPAAVGNLAISLHSARNEMKSLREESRGKRLAVLSTEQKTKLEAFEAAAKFLKRGPMRAPRN